MHVNAHLDVDVVALEQDDTVHLLLELQSPPAPATDAKRVAQTIVVLLDRSGSMDGPRLYAAKSALLALVDRLDPTDTLGVVAFDDTAQVVLPARPGVCSRTAPSSPPSTRSWPSPSFRASPSRWTWSSSAGRA